MPDPQYLRSLLARYATVRIALAQGDVRASTQELEDVTYTLCVTTGTNTIDDALAAADAVLARQRPGKPARPTVPAQTRTSASAPVPNTTLAA